MGHYAAQRTWLRLGIFGFLLLLAVPACGGGGGTSEGEDPAVWLLDWAHPQGGGHTDEGMGVAAREDGSFVVVGEFHNTMTLGAGEPNETTLTTTASAKGLYIAAYAGNGMLLWAKFLGSTSLPFVEDVAAFPDGSFVVAGSIQQDLTLEVGEPDEITLHSVGIFDGFLARYGPGGDLDWARRDGVDGSIFFYGVDTFADGSFMTTGNYGGQTTFGEGDPTEVRVIDAGAGDAFVARYLPDGALDWVRRAGGTGQDRAYGVVALSGGECAMCGFFLDTATFGAGEPQQTQLTSAGNIDAFVARYSPTGNLLWAQRAGGTGYDSAPGLTALTDGSLILGGYFEDTATWAPGLASERTLTSAGADDCFLARYESTGSLLWVVGAGGTEDDRILDLVALPGGGVAGSGSFRSGATFGSGDPNQETVEPVGQSDSFVASYDDAGRLEWIATGGSSSGDAGSSVTAVGSRVVATGRYETGEAVFGAGEPNETTLPPFGDMDGFLVCYRAE